MPYSGNLRAQNQKPDERQFPAPDVAHGKNEGDPYPQKWTAPPGADFSNTDFPTTVTRAPGLTLDRPGLLGHDSQANLQNYSTDADWARDIPYHHDADAERGWLGTDSTYYPPPLQDNYTTYDADVVQAYGSPAPNPVVLQRGKNSLAQNNPDVDGYDPGGFRRGFWRWKSVWRQRLDNMHRTYDLQPVWDRNIQVIESSPAQGVFWGPFSDSMARGFTRMNATPALAREAVDPSDAVESQADYGLNYDSVIGAF
ncbi:hypothetical protein SAMN05216489_09985 [Streptomyces sp. 3213]|uniref:hypothetical protein n=1 Tax=Streptomyces sp. 3213.3 TaxID=1855348 RepID=UPI00089845C6|nr:hypothetical protein [Streptomyces sp. 3213.3]SEF12899.1 hypothetical protein SAMN05216489_09985 [Streptomyces sp. 3213] [Streptomyces sp. 3213.3]